MSLIGRAAPFVAGVSDFAFNIAGGVDLNLRTQALAAGWNGSSPVICTVTASIWGNSVALTVNGSFPGGVTLINNAVIYGLSGSPGSGGNAVVNGFGSGGGGGNGGGHGLVIAVPLKLINNGAIWGTGGSGGGGGSCNNPAHTVGYNGSGGGLGGQYPNNVSSAGGANTSPYGSNAGGAGGDCYTAGTAGDTPTGDYWAPGGAGGAFGYAISGTSQLLGGSVLGGYVGNTAG